MGADIWQRVTLSAATSTPMHKRSTIEPYAAKATQIGWQRR